MAINSINPWSGLSWSPPSVPNCSVASQALAGGGCCAPNSDQLRFAMMRQLQWMESMLERLAGMLGGAQPGQPPLPCSAAGLLPCPSLPCASVPAAPSAAPTSPSAPVAAAPAPRGSTGKPDAGGSGMKAGAPPGYHTIKGAVPPGVTAKAKSLLNQPMGSEHTFENDGKRYLARLEHHYHPPGYQGGPNGWHKGVSVYEAN